MSDRRVEGYQPAARFGEQLHPPQGGSHVRQPPRDVWVVGTVINDVVGAWALIGVFDEKALALACCRDASYFLTHARLNEDLPDKTVDWSDAYYPKRVTP